jgi:phosphoribosyl 1,2-cyclic phosphate phosphodiesterase
MILTILGCGTSTGVPLIHCDCAVCTSNESKNKRLRCSAWLQVDGKNFLIDTSPDLRQQAIRAKISRIDAVLYTHPHADHLHGIDELRSFNFIQKSSIPVYGNQWTYDDLKIKFPYIFNPGPVEGGGIPLLTLNLFDARASVIEIQGVKIIPISLSHGSKECIGYRFDSLAYVTDCSYIPPVSMDRLKGLSVLVLDCLRLEPHGTHFNLDQALETVSKLKPKQTFLTHLGHEFDYVEYGKKLPKGVSFAYDGLIINA